MSNRYLLDITALAKADKALENAVKHLDDPKKARRYIRQAQRELKGVVKVAEATDETQS